MLTEILAVFMQKGVDAIQLITPYALGLLATIMALDFTWSAIQIVLNDGNNMFKIFVQKTVRYGVFSMVVKDYKSIIDKVIYSFTKVGLVAGGSGISEQKATDPSYIIDLGYKLMDRMYTFRDIVQQSDGPASVGIQGIVNGVMAAAKGELTVAKLFPNFFFWLVSLLILAAFTIIAIQLFATWIETYFISSLSLIFMPCAVFSPFAFVAEKAIGAIIGAGTKLMMLLFVISVSFPIIEQWTITANPSTYESIKLLTTAAAIAYLCWQAPSLAAGLMTGAPSLSGGGAIALGVGATMAITKAITSGFSSLQQLIQPSADSASAENTMRAASMEGVGGSSSPVSSPTIPQEKNNAPAGGLTAEGVMNRMTPQAQTAVGGGESQADSSRAGGIYMPNGSWHSFSGATGGGTNSSSGTSSGDAQPSGSNDSFGSVGSYGNTSSSNMANIGGSGDSTAISKGQNMHPVGDMTVENISKRLQQPSIKDKDHLD